jgi:hypothetical protein
MGLIPKYPIFKWSKRWQSDDKILAGVGCIWPVTHLDEKDLSFTAVPMYCLIWERVRLRWLEDAENEAKGTS